MVQESPSEQGPSFTMLVHPSMGSQVSTVQEFSSSQARSPPAAHTPSTTSNAPWQQRAKHWQAEGRPRAMTLAKCTSRNKMPYSLTMVSTSVEASGDSCSMKS